MFDVFLCSHLALTGQISTTISPTLVAVTGLKHRLYAEKTMILQLFTQPFCAPCVRTRQVVHRVHELLPELQIQEIDVVRDWQAGQAAAVSSTPVIRLLEQDQVIFRSAAVPTVNQLLTAIAAHRKM
ncbi:thioredoxin domain-containing protein [Glutamicibacter uratoxydans]|uniref:thioredoxin domain-containing protein n=1 Tax=Glutamicibacter uratoxydans TaxID=43667 RepID=UPI003D701569